MCVLTGQPIARVAYREPLASATFIELWLSSAAADPTRRRVQPPARRGRPGKKGLGAVSRILGGIKVNQTHHFLMTGFNPNPPLKIKKTHLFQIRRFKFNMK